MSDIGSDEPRRRLPQPPTTPVGPGPSWQPSAQPPARPSAGAHAQPSDPAYPPTRPAAATFPPMTAASLAAQTGDAPVGSGPDAPDADAARRRKLLLIGGGVAGLVVLGGIAYALLSSQGDDSAAPAATSSTVVLPSPTPTVEPVARTSTSAFSVALPVSVLQFALASSEPATDWIAAGAIESSLETYTDGGTEQVVVQAGQWETPEAAAAYAQVLVAALPVADAAAASPSATAEAPALPESGDVTVDGAVVGTYSIVDAGDGTGIAVWTNGTAVFRAVAPVAEIHDVYAAFPL